MPAQRELAAVMGLDFAPGDACFGERFGPDAGMPASAEGSDRMPGDAGRGVFPPLVQPSSPPEQRLSQGLTPIFCKNRSDQAAKS